MKTLLLLLIGLGSGLSTDAQSLTSVPFTPAVAARLAQANRLIDLQQNQTRLAFQNPVLYIDWQHLNTDRNTLLIDEQQALDDWKWQVGDRALVKADREHHLARLATDQKHLRYDDHAVAADQKAVMSDQRRVANDWNVFDNDAHKAGVNLNQYNADRAALRTDWKLLNIHFQ